MTDKDLENSITLIGPSCVGKSLIALELSQKLDMSVISIDDLITLTQQEQSGLISRDKTIQKQFVDSLIVDIAYDNELSSFLNNPRLKNKQIKLINEVVDLYNKYADMFDGLECFYEIINRHNQRVGFIKSHIENIENLKLVAVELVATIMQKINKPVIFDMPAPFGWETKSESYQLYLQKSFLNENGMLSIVNKFMNSFLSETTSVLLVPGRDYSKRNTTRNSVENNLLLKDFNNYYENADICITTNALFNKPSNKFLQRRSWLNPEEAIVKEKLKNKGEIGNICDEIILRVEELKEMEEVMPD